MDPIDHRNAYVGKSGILGSGEGLFARRDILPGELVVLYPGVHVASLAEVFTGKGDEDAKLLHQILAW